MGATVRIGLRTVAAVLTLLVVVLSGTPAQAAKRLSVSKTKGLDRAGQTVTVTGRGYDVKKGIYVAFCLDNGAGVIPSPCGGGADMSGSSGSSAWISSNPPSYGEGLATPFGAGGSFTVPIRVSQMIGDVDCAVRGCAIVTRADHTRTSDRSQDVRIAVRFAPARTGTAVTAAPSPVNGAAVAPAGKPTSPPVGPPTGRLATAAPPAATTVAGVPAADLALTRTSAATPLGHWWAIGGAFLVGLLAASVAGRIRRRKGSRA
ncbi:hypothetical protein ADL15_17175 [Actinoplanes awajinensis subsp. mycoplanecinus]|uniref:Uncharacterized protein n=1 Tax=Actinoplanes awajinensis subsp. mycoplanecinus TaxID=135947 RepID=A0A0X3UM52_9ACTN|nr:hypothetical protein ADL15_17175 [Actinoplanes awajinensis subsp. mycoplanecinus]